MVDLDDVFDEDDTYENSDEGAADAAKFAREYLAWLNRRELFETST
ncbi:MAG: hypothetical protein JWR36_1257 [Glaciihabitans sp.]|jgi:hypothetical protein|nr:hypothetical protein [Glaciihabitans sp.]